MFHGAGPLDPRWGSFDTFKVVRHAGGPPGPVPLPGEATPIAAEQVDAREFYRLLATALTEDGPLPVDPAESLHVLRVLDAAARSAADDGAPARVAADGHGSDPAARGRLRGNAADSIGR
jgi:predicted dehydrogenase